MGKKSKQSIQVDVLNQYYFINAKGCYFSYFISLLINIIIALASLLFLIKIFLRLLTITTSTIKDKQKWKYFFQDSKTQFWSGNFKPFQIYRTVYYITIIVELIQYPEAQSILLSMQSLFYLIYLIYFRPLISNFYLAKLLCREVVFLIITGSFLVQSQEFNEDKFLVYGWLHIGLFCFIIGFTLIVDILDQGIQAYNFHLKNKRKKKQEKQRNIIIIHYKVTYWENQYKFRKRFYFLGLNDLQQFFIQQNF
ncbi:unnamed protein product [Paramecium sonneborni]|uniref:Transmembrane protein n=1 Tax=Paramecium sonneborni TaxID=65129 RepID=A0A8S1RWZ4_9CILI|nr:unnamed protein product [Paramecium sonneborni]